MLTRRQPRYNCFCINLDHISALKASRNPRSSPRRMQRASTKDIYQRHRYVHLRSQKHAIPHSSLQRSSAPLPNSSRNSTHRQKDLSYCWSDYSRRHTRDHVNVAEQSRQSIMGRRCLIFQPRPLVDWTERRTRWGKSAECTVDIFAWSTKLYRADFRSDRDESASCGVGEEIPL